MSMRYTGKAWKRVRKASGKTLIEQIRQAKYNETRAKLKRGKSAPLRNFELRQEIIDGLRNGTLIAEAPISSNYEKQLARITNGIPTDGFNSP